MRVICEKKENQESKKIKGVARKQESTNKYSYVHKRESTCTDEDGRDYGGSTILDLRH